MLLHCWPSLPLCLARNASRSEPFSSSAGVRHRNNLAADRLPARRSVLAASAFERSAKSAGRWARRGRGRCPRVGWRGGAYAGRAAEAQQRRLWQEEGVLSLSVPQQPRRRQHRHRSPRPRSAFGWLLALALGSPSLSPSRPLSLHRRCERTITRDTPRSCTHLSSLFRVPSSSSSSLLPPRSPSRPRLACSATAPCCSRSSSCSSRSRCHRAPSPRCLPRRSRSSRSGRLSRTASRAC